MTIQQVQAEVVEEFSFLKDWEERYAYLIDLGKELPLIDNQYKTDDYLIKGCQSKVWLFAQLADGKVLFTADSDAIITKGIVALLVRVFSGQAPEDIIKADAGFIDQIGLKEHLSPTRANGLVSMIEQMKRYAVAFSLMEK